MPQTVALIAHDGKKDDMVRLAIAQRALLEKFHLIATGTTGERVARMTNLVIERMLSGPMGGDAQIAARVAEGKVVAHDRLAISLAGVFSGFRYAPVDDNEDRDQPMQRHR